MSFDKKTIQNISHLARLSLSDDAQEKFTKELDGILTWVEQLNQVDISTVEPLATIADTSNRFRPDQVTEGHIQNDLMQNAPESMMGFYVVPKMVE